MSNRRCSYCHQTGHTKPTCPTLANWIEVRRARLGNDDWHVSAYDEKKSKKRNSATNRKCSYCRDEGHTRRKCSALQEDMETTRSILVDFRRNWFNRCVEDGLGPGALVAAERGANRILYLVRRVLTSEVVWWNKPTCPCVAVKRERLTSDLRALSWHEQRLGWPSAIKRAADNRGRVGSFGLIHGPSESAIKAQFSSAWLNARDGSVEKAFKWSSRKYDRGCFAFKIDFDWYTRQSRDVLVEIR